MKTYSLDDIARYAEGEMPAEESQAFEQALAADDALRQQLAFYHDVHDSLQQHFTKDAGEVQLENTLQQLRGEFFHKQSQPAKVVSINRVLSYAMGVAAVLVIALFLWKPWQPGLFEQYSDVKMVNPAERGENADSLLRKAAVAFNKKEFADAAAYLSEARHLQPGDSFTGYYFGVAMIQIDQVLPARQALEEIYNGESVYKYEAAFFMALSYLKEKNKPTARIWLEKIPADAQNYDKAQELLKKL